MCCLDRKPDGMFSCDEARIESDYYIVGQGQKASAISYEKTPDAPPDYMQSMVEISLEKLEKLDKLGNIVRLLEKIDSRLDNMDNKMDKLEERVSKLE